jgi:hypothetical protein
LRVGISAATINLKVGTPELPLGAAKKVLADSELREKLRVPEEVTGLPLTVKIEGALNPTLVTVPVPPVAEMVMSCPEGVIVIPVPGNKVISPVIELRLVTPLIPPPLPEKGHE